MQFAAKTGGLSLNTGSSPKLNLTPAPLEATLLRAILLVELVKNGTFLITSGCAANGVIPSKSG